MNEWMHVGVDGGQGSALAPGPQDPCSSMPSPGGVAAPAGSVPTPELSQALRRFLSSRTCPTLRASGRRQLIEGKGQCVQAWPPAWAGGTMSRARQAEQDTACGRVLVSNGDGGSGEGGR